MLVGRSIETASIDRLLGDARDGRSGVLVLRGEPGIGKSALLEYAVGQAGGFRVLRGVGIESETELAYAALHQILRPILNRIDALPDPQAAALRAAFALSGETVDERFRVSLGALGLLADAADDTPLLCVVDDAQWLDQASADALFFVARRLEAEGIVFLFAARDEGQRPVVGDRLPELRIAPLSQADARAVLTDRLDTTAAGVIEWLVDSANGNPLALVELPGTLSAAQLAGQESVVGKLPPATSIEQVYLERVEALPESARKLLLIAAAEETGARATIEHAGESLGLEIGALAIAESTGLVRIDADHLIFRHPLVRTAIYRSASFTERERAHRILSETSAAEGNADRAAWHRAAATVGADEGVARELESTAARARLRGGHAAAASALARAAELSPTSESVARRLAAAAGAAWQAGQPERAKALLARASPLAADPELVAEIHHLHGVIEWRCGSLPAACTILIDGASEIAQLEEHKALDMLADAGMASWDSGDFGRLAEVGEAAAALRRDDDAEHAVLANVLVGAVRLSLGEAPGDVPFALDAIPRAAESEEPRILIWAAIAAEVAGESASETALLGRAAAIARASGAVDRLTVALESMSVQGFLAGRFTVSAEASEGLRLATDAGLPNAAHLHLATLAWLAAVQGREDECRANAARVIEAALPNGHGISISIAEWALALLDLGIGRPAEAVSRLIALSTAPPGVAHPFYVLNSAPDLVEACMRAGDRESALNAFEVVAAFAKPESPTWVRAFAARCRGLLADGEEADSEFGAALQLHGEGTNLFDRARTELVYGEFLRRGRRRLDAREQLRAAAEAFERLRAEPWAERARTELRASGETARKRDPSTLAELTPQELQIARLVAEGGSNKEVAAQLFLSPRTIDYHLRKVFMKLGITSRAELIRHGVLADVEGSEREIAVT